VNCPSTKETPTVDSPNDVVQLSRRRLPEQSIDDILNSIGSMRLHNRATIGIIKSAVSRQWRAARSHSQMILRGAGGWVRGELFSLEELLKLRDCLRQKSEEAVSQRLGVGLHLGERRSSPLG